MSGAGGLNYDRYTTSGHQEWLMRIGHADDIPLLLVPPLLEEMNRTRAFIATLMRRLAALGFSCWLIDLPGTGESERPLEACTWGEWRQAVADAANCIERKPLIASIRGGALLDDAAAGLPIWRFAPAEGSSLARDLVRASMLKPEQLKEARIDLAGYRLSDTLFAALSEAKSEGPSRTVRLASDRAEADLKVEGAALWRRSEPGNDPELAALLADDLAAWGKQCAAS